MAAGPHNPPVHDNCARPVIHATDALSIRDGLVPLRARSELGVALDRRQSPGVRTFDDACLVWQSKCTDNARHETKRRGQQTYRTV
jgi:hypothetical protein